MTLKEFLNTFHLLMHDNVAVFRYDAWDGAPEFVCTIRELKYHNDYADLMDKEVRGICSGHEQAMCWIDYEAIENGVNIFEIALDWDGDWEEVTYEYGCIVGMNVHDVCDNADTLEEAWFRCELLQRDWDGTSVGDWEFNGKEWRAQSSDPDEPWYVREIRE